MTYRLHCPAHSYELASVNHWAKWSFEATVSGTNRSVAIEMFC